MKILGSLLVILTLVLTVSAARALTIENRSSDTASVMIMNGDQSKVFSVASGQTQTAPCSAKCTVELGGNQIKVAKDGHVVISTDGTLKTVAAAKMDDMKTGGMKTGGMKGGQKK